MVRGGGERRSKERGRWGTYHQVAEGEDDLRGGAAEFDSVCFAHAHCGEVLDLGARGTGRGLVVLKELLKASAVRL